MLRPELLTLYRSHADEDDSGFYSIHAVRDLFDHIDAQAERIAALEAALSEYADTYGTRIQLPDEGAGLMAEIKRPVLAEDMRRLYGVVWSCAEVLMAYAASGRADGLFNNADLVALIEEHYAGLGRAVERLREAVDAWRAQLDGSQK